MRVVVEGVKDGKKESVEYNLLDKYDPVTKTSSMSRTTGYTCAAAVHLMARGLFSQKGVFPPEYVGKYPGCFEFVLNYLRARGVYWRKTADC
jgi:saccharopine dehydrogenase-like NADP-dependent oxidoreductase